MALREYNKTYPLLPADCHKLRTSESLTIERGYGGGKRGCFSGIGGRFKLRLMLALVVVLASGFTGCIWLAVPSLAYQGYKYEHKTDSDSKPGAASSSASGRNAQSDHSIE
jgi:hypothetical protein